METQDANNSASDESVHAESEAELANEALATEDTSTDDTTDLEQDNQEDDGDDVDWEGKQYRLPKGMKDALLMRADYTRKTQEVANEREAVKAERQAIAERQQAQEALIGEHAKVKNLEDYVRYYDNVDWDAADEQNPEVAQKEWRRYQQLQQQLNAAKSELQTKIDGRLKEQHAAQAQALQETGRTLAQKIPGWNQELAGKLVEVASSLGYSQDELLRDPDPRDFMLLHELYKARQTNNKQATGTQAAKQATTAPLKVVGAKAPPASPMSDKSDIKAWMEARNKKVRKG